MLKIKSDNKIYEALMVEKETRQKFKEIKPDNKTNTELLIEMIRMYEYNVKKYPLKVL